MRTIRALAFASVSLITFAVPAFAQDLPAKDAEETGALGSTDDIIVSARRREESVQDVPQVVNVVTSEQIEKLNIRTFSEIQQIVPGLTMQSTQVYSNQATVRGVAFIPEASGTNPSVEFYLNDAPIASGFLFQSTFDFGQFELQRGPQGTLRGRAAPSGSIAVTTRRPDLSEVGLVVNGTLANRHAGKIDGAINVPVIRDMLAVRIAGVVDQSMGSFTRSTKEISDPDHNERPYRNTQGLRASARFAPADWFEGNFMYQNLQTRSHNYGQIVSDSVIAGTTATTRIVRPSDRLSFDDQGGYGHQDMEIYVGNADARFAGQKLSYVFSYTNQDFGGLGGGDTTDFFPSATPRPIGDPAGGATVCDYESRKTDFPGATNGGFFQCTHGKGKRWTHEIRLASEDRVAGIFDYVIGYLHDKNAGGTELTQETPILGILPGGAIFVNRTPIVRVNGSLEKSYFGNLTAHFGNFEISGGLRHIDFYDFGSLAISGTIQDPATRSPGKATVYTGSVKYQISPDMMVYAQTGSSWRPGPRAVGNFSVQKTALERSFTDLPPERSKSYEIGTKTTFMDGRGRFNISAFYQKFKDYPYRNDAGVPYINFRADPSTPLGIAESASFNFLAAVPVTVKGIEAEAFFRIADHWSISGNVAYADGKIKNGTFACLDLNGDGQPDANAAQPTLAQLQAALPAGQHIATCSGLNRRSLNSPKLSANIQTEYGIEFGPSTEGFVRASGSFYGKTVNVPENSFDDIGAYALLNLYAGIRDPEGQWEVSLFGKNVFNTQKVTSVGSGVITQSIRTPAPTTFRSEYRAITMTVPREFGVTARIAIGSR